VKGKNRKDNAKGKSSKGKRYLIWEGKNNTPNDIIFGLTIRFPSVINSTPYTILQHKNHFFLYFK
jgi:hypothetical protein